MNMFQRSGDCSHEFLRYCVLTFSILCLTGCMTDRASYSRNDPSLAVAAEWTAQGKLSYDLNGQRGNFSFRWFQQRATFDIVLYGPLGVSIATITGDEKSARIKTSDGQERAASSPEVLMRETLGLDLPVSAMVHWLRGVPRDDKDIHMAVDRAGLDFNDTQVHEYKDQSGGFSQSGWEVVVLRRDDAANPSRLRITKPGAKLLVIVKRWLY